MHIHQPILVSVSLPHLELSQEIAVQLFDKKLIACAQFSSIQSMYPWQGKLERSQEVIMQLKTIQSKWPELQELLKKLHPYEVPEIIATPILEIQPDYLDWMLNVLDLSGQKWYV